MVVEKNEFLITAIVTIAKIHDYKAIVFIGKLLNELNSGIRLILIGGGYRGEVIDLMKQKFGYMMKVVYSGYKDSDFRKSKL